MKSFDVRLEEVGVVPKLIGQIGKPHSSDSVLGKIVVTLEEGKNNEILFLGENIPEFLFKELEMIGRNNDFTISSCKKNGRNYFWVKGIISSREYSLKMFADIFLKEMDNTINKA